MNKTSKPITIVGISMITSNEAALNQNTIGKLWDDFLKTPIKEQLGDTRSSSVFAVYSDYENGYLGKFKITIGYAVDDMDKIPDGLTTVMIPAGNYKTFISNSRAVADIVDTWKTIWEMDPNLFRRDFIADYEEYNGDDATIHIGYESV